ncbi:hypothetical protein B9Z55_025323 [Caenorhabditis nigoni]|uniref:Major facilitator superfamily (MFS) profile domain-containing protein n=1 Tax=Caenorhabditis nigoni TaxID=1611254 RepID=A0A2G5SXY0_9PELO|nr:hypothetical protein B9Z55_025323 [Caenorhabditis nigoni]
MPFEINRFHALVFVTWQLANLAVGQYIFSIFATFVPSFRCGDGPVTRNCRTFETCNKSELVFVDEMFASAAIEFEWVCSHHNAKFNSIQFGGVLVGTVFFGIASDYFGRKPIGVIAILISICSSFATGLSPNLHFLYVARFCGGLSIAGVLVVVCAWILESILPHQRMVVRGFFNWGWTRIFTTLICYFAGEWRMASCVFALCLMPALFMTVFVLPESPIWLHSKGRITEMIETEKYMANIAGVPFVPVEHHLIESKSFWAVIKTKGTFFKLFILWIFWFGVAVCGFSNDLNSGKLVGNLYMNQILFGIIIVISKVVLLFVDKNFDWFKRRTLHQGSIAGTVLCFGVLGAMCHNDYHGTGVLVVFLIGTLMIEYTWDAVYLITIESMETSSRTSTSGSCSFLARMGSLVAPILTHISTWWPLVFYITVMVIGSITFVISYFFLEETKDVDLDEVHIEKKEISPDEIPMLEMKEA